MAAKKILKSEEGSGIVEIIVFLPLMLLLSHIMVNSFYTINTSITGQSWVRTKLNYFLGNSAYYPVSDGLTETAYRKDLVSKNQFFVGLNDVEYNDTEKPIPMLRMIVPNSEKPKPQVKILVGICTYDVVNFEHNERQLNDVYVNQVMSGSIPNEYCEGI